jgi:hypothetical protein
MQASPTYPLKLDAELDPGLSRWLWIFKFVLVIPHIVVLAFLWVAFSVLTVIAFFAILFTGSYPRSIFEFNTGVLRWSWRVGYYSFAANGTDRYPPFALDDVPEYPAHLEIAYPQRLSRWLVLVKSWLLAIPQLIVVGLFAGGAWFAYEAAHTTVPAGGGGLIGILVLVAVVILLATGRYPQSLYDFILGMDRWVLRVAAYVGLMTDRYPPFRLDMGGHEIATLSIQEAGEVQRTETASIAMPAAPPRWSGGRIVMLVAGSILALVSVALLFGGAASLWADRTQRDAAGFISSPTHQYVTSAAALTTSSIDLGSANDVVPQAFLGDVRIRVEPVRSNAAVFIGIAPTSAVDSYLAGVSRAIVTNFAQTSVVASPGGAASAPARQSFWEASISGTGGQTLLWHASGGAWTVVTMAPSGHPGLALRVDVAATLPGLGWIATGLLVVGVLALVGGILLIVFSVARPSRRRSAA